MQLLTLHMCSLFYTTGKLIVGVLEKVTDSSWEVLHK